MAPLFLLALFLTYQVSITMFTHVHIINGVMIVHSHPSSDDHHTHTAGQVITIAHIGSYQTPEPEAGVSNVTVECPLLYVLGLNTNTFIKIWYEKDNCLFQKVRSLSSERT